MRDFDGPEEFLESLRDADIVRKRQSLLYVQALKFIQTKATRARAASGTARAGHEARASGEPSDGQTAQQVMQARGQRRAPSNP